jgi:sugar porter (SP) family MFS transporter
VSGIVIVDEITDCTRRFWINYGTQRHFASNNNNQWRIPVAVQVIPGGLLLISMFIVWESPRWLAQKGRFDETIQTLSRIRQLPPNHPYIMDEVNDIRAQIAREREVNSGSSYWQLLKEFTGRGYRNRLGIGVGMMVFQNLSGINAINYYSPTIFKSLGVSSTSTTLFATGIYGVVKLVASVIFLVWLLDRVGRRRSLLIGSIGAAIPMWYIGAFIAKAKPSPTDTQQSAGGWVAVVAIYVFVVFYCASWNGIAWIIPSEIFPLRLRTLGVTISKHSAHPLLSPISPIPQQP